MECKNYSHPVPVDDVEEFVAKLDQVAGKNVKDALFSTANFQQGALSYAKSKGIALVRILPDHQVQWILRRTSAAIESSRHGNSHVNEALQGLSIFEYVGQFKNIFGSVYKINSTSLTEILNGLILDNRFARASAIKVDRGKGKISEVPFIGQPQLESCTASLVEEFNQGGYNNKTVDLVRVCNFLEKTYNVIFVFNDDLGFDADGREILGKLSFNPMRLYVSSSIERNSPRWRYTVAHEMGHFLLHQHVNLPSIVGTRLETEKNHRSRLFDDDPNIIRRLEWQANAFASCLLMPRDRVFELLVNHIRRMGLNSFSHGIIFLDDQPCNLWSFNTLMSNLSKHFNVSKQAAEYRIAQLGLLNDHRRPTRIANLLKPALAELLGDLD